MGAHGESEEQGCARARPPVRPFAKRSVRQWCGGIHGAIDHGVAQLPPSWRLFNPAAMPPVAAAAAMLERAHARGRARA